VFFDSVSVFAPTFSFLHNFFVCVNIAYKFFTLFPPGEYFLERPLALAARLPGGKYFRDSVKKISKPAVKVAKTVEPVIRSSFPESFIFDDFPE
jgi:hypothetical protein